MNSNRVVITGLGSINPVGNGYRQMWDGFCEGRCGIDKVSAFDAGGFKCQLAGEVRDFKVRSFIPKSMRKSVKLMCRDIKLAVAAADEALRDSGLVTRQTDTEAVNVEPERIGINIGAGLISCELPELGPAAAMSVVDGKFDIRKWGSDGIEHVTPLWLLKYLPNMPACHIGIIHNIQGPSNTIVCAEAGGQIAISEASQVIGRGVVDIALAGAVEAKVNPIVLARQIIFGRSATEHNDEPERACRPFDADAGGAVFGEGAGIVVLEELERAKSRGAEIYAEVAGTGGSNSLQAGYIHLEQDGGGISRAIEQALEEAGIGPEELDMVIPHGTGIARDDMAEARGIAAALGSAVEGVSVWPTKSMVSNTGAASGAIDVVAAVCAMKNGVIPAARNCDNIAEGCRLKINREVKRGRIGYALCCSYTYGGQTAAVVLKNPDGEQNG